MGLIKIKNTAKEGLTLLQWRVLPDGRCRNLRTNEICDGLPDTVAYSPQAKKFADMGKIKIPGYGIETEKKAIVTPPLETGIFSPPSEDTDVVTSAIEEEEEEEADEKGTESTRSGSKKKKARKGGR